MSDILLSKFQGKPVVLVANIFQHSPVTLLATQKSGFSSPQDLFKKNIRMVKGIKSAELQAMFLNEGVAIKDLNVSTPVWSMEDLVSGKVDAISAYVSSQPYHLNKQSIPSSLISPITYGIDFYGDNLFTSEAEVTGNPERVASFRRASLKGWAYALENPKEIVELILSKYGDTNKSLDREFLMNEAAIYQNLIQAEFVKLGHTNPGRWKHIADTYVRLGMADQDYSLDGFFFQPDMKSFSWNHWSIKLFSTITLFGIGATLLLSIFNRRMKREIVAHQRTEKELKKSETRYARAVRGTSDGIWDWNIVTNEAYFSPRWKELLGFTPDELINEYDTFFSRIHPGDVSLVQESLTAHLEQCTPYNIKHRLRTKSDQYKWFQIRGMAERDEQGQAVIMSGSITDITELMQSEADMGKLERQLLQAQKLEAVGQLASGIAHEINTPAQYIGTNVEFLDEAFREILNIFASIQAGMNVLEQGKSAATKLDEILKEADWEYLSEEIPSAINQSKQGILRVSSIVRAMKEFSHPGGRSKEPADLNHIIANTVTVARNEWKYVANVKTDFDTNIPNIPILINEMGQVVLILLVNAAQAIAEKLGENPTDEKGTITITTSILKSGIQLRISDTGMGIPKTVRPRIFDPFYTTKIVGKGTGQGLTIAHDVITAKHGGTIDFTTKTDQGTEFVIWLPGEKGNA